MKTAARELTRSLQGKIILVWFLLSISLGLFARFAFFSTVPHGITWDEAAIGYNGYSIWTTRRDEWLQFLPVSFRSFGDYKAPLAIYLVGGFTQLFNLSPLAVRLPFLLASLVTLCAFLVLASELSKLAGFTQKKQWLVSFSAITLLATSSWHIHFSRIAMESGLALSLISVGMALFFVVLRLLPQRQGKLIWVYFGAMIFSIVAAAYVYHSVKIFMPILGLALVLFFWRSLAKDCIVWFAGVCIGVVGLIPLLYDAILGDGLTRANTLLIGKLPLSQLVEKILQQFLIHISPDFLIGGAATSLRHGSGYLGVLFVTTLLFMLAGAVSLIFQSNSVSKTAGFSSKKLLLFLIVWIFAGILPAALGEEVPHSNRSLLALPGFLLLGAVGIASLYEYCEKQMHSTHWFHHGKIAEVAFLALLGTHLLLTVSFVKHYFTVFARVSAVDFQDGYLETFATTRLYDKGLEGHAVVDKILFTSDYGQPYIYALFVGKTNPIWYQGGSLVRYEFADTITSADLLRKNVLVVASARDEMGETPPTKTVYGSDGKARFRIYLTSNN